MTMTGRCCLCNQTCVGKFQPRDDETRKVVIEGLSAEATTNPMEEIWRDDVRFPTWSIPDQPHTGTTTDVAIGDAGLRSSDCLTHYCMDYESTLTWHTHAVDDPGVTDQPEPFEVEMDWQENDTRCCKTIRKYTGQPFETVDYGTVDSSDVTKQITFSNIPCAPGNLITNAKVYRVYQDDVGTDRVVSIHYNTAIGEDPVDFTAAPRSAFSDQPSGSFAMQPAIGPNAPGGRASRYNNYGHFELLPDVLASFGNPFTGASRNALHFHPFLYVNENIQARAFSSWIPSTVTTLRSAPLIIGRRVGEHNRFHYSATVCPGGDTTVSGRYVPDLRPGYRVWATIGQNRFPLPAEPAGNAKLLSVGSAGDAVNPYIVGNSSPPGMSVTFGFRTVAINDKNPSSATQGFFGYVKAEPGVATNDPLIGQEQTYTASHIQNFWAYSSSYALGWYCVPYFLADVTLELTWRIESRSGETIESGTDGNGWNRDWPRTNFEREGGHLWKAASADWKGTTEKKQWKNAEDFTYDLTEEPAITKGVVSASEYAEHNGIRYQIPPEVGERLTVDSVTEPSTDGTGTRTRLEEEEEQ